MRLLHLLGSVVLVFVASYPLKHCVLGGCFAISWRGIAFHSRRNLVRPLSTVAIACGELVVPVAVVLQTFSLLLELPCRRLRLGYLSQPRWGRIA